LEIKKNYSINRKDKELFEKEIISVECGKDITVIIDKNG